MGAASKIAVAVFFSALPASFLVGRLSPRGLLKASVAIFGVWIAVLFGLDSGPNIPALAFSAICIATPLVTARPLLSRRIEEGYGDSFVARKFGSKYAVSMLLESTQLPLLEDKEFAESMRKVIQACRSEGMIVSYAVSVSPLSRRSVRVIDSALSRTLPQNRTPSVAERVERKRMAKEAEELLELREKGVDVTVTVRVTSIAGDLQSAAVKCKKDAEKVVTLFSAMGFRLEPVTGKRLRAYDFFRRPLIGGEDVSSLMVSPQALEQKEILEVWRHSEESVFDQEGLFLGWKLSRAGSEVPLNLNPNLLTTHCVVVGSTGAGKTCLLHLLVEELRKYGVPVVILDFVGEYERVTKELGGVIYTPARPIGRNLVVSYGVLPEESTALMDALRTAVEKIAKLAKLSKGEKRILKYSLLMAARKGVRTITYREILRALEEAEEIPPTGVKPEAVAKLRQILEMELSFHKHLFSEKCTPIEEILSSPVSLIDLRFTDEETALDISLWVLERIYYYMYRQKITGDLKLAVVLDETHRFLGNKEFAMRFIKCVKELRKFGVGVIAGSQSITDFTTTKGAAIQKNFNTWFFGRVTYRSEASLVNSMAQCAAGDLCMSFPSNSGRWILKDAKGRLAVMQARMPEVRPGQLSVEEIKSLYGQEEGSREQEELSLIHI